MQPENNYDAGLAPVERSVEKAGHYCAACGHPNDYHDAQRGCTMPLDRSGLPVTRTSETVSSCGCTGTVDPIRSYAETREAVEGVREHLVRLLDALDNDDDDRADYLRREASGLVAAADRARSAVGRHLALSIPPVEEDGDA